MKTFLKIFYIVFLFASASEVYSQSVIWRQIIGEQYNEVAYNCIELRDGGYLMAGYKNIIYPGSPFFIPKSYLVRLDHYGNILWEKIIGDSTNPNTSVTLIEDPFGNIYLPYYSGYAHLAKLNSKGEILWIKEYPFHNIEIFVGISFIDNYRNLIFLSQNLIQKFRTASVTKVDSSGNLIWNKAYYDTLSLLGTYNLGSNNSYWFSDLEYFISGYVTPSPGVINRVGFIIKLDTNGNIIWNKKYPQCKGIFSIAQNSLNTFIASGQADAVGFLYCHKFDSSGNVIWSRNYSTDTLAAVISFYKIIKNFENNFALGTTSTISLGRLLIIDSLGSIVSSKFYNYPPGFYINQYNINNTTDSGYIVAGSLDSNNTFTKSLKRGNKQIDVLLFKIDKYGNTVSIRNNQSTSIENFDISVYPNPYNLSFNINFNLINKSDVTINLYDISGKLVKIIKKSILIQGNHKFPVYTPELSSGIYFLSINIDLKSFTKKILLIK
ncbi:MAG: T9SS type A sorting domain-containing protein [Bacteroidota bacterium]|nr:T9SS type A sorting domain-containing protein [Bacteroidota bacterium]